MVYFRYNHFVLLITNYDFLFMWSAQPSFLTEVTMMLDYNFKTNPGVKDLPRPGIEPQSPSPQSDTITIRPQRPIWIGKPLITNEFIGHQNGLLIYWNHQKYLLESLQSICMFIYLIVWQYNFKSETNCSTNL